MTRRPRLRRPSAAMVVALVALSSSLAGGAIAARLITSADVKNRSLLAKDFKKGQLPKAAAVKMARGNNVVIDSDAPKQVASLSIKAPAKGFVTLIYSATMDAQTPSIWLDVFLTERGERLNGSEFWDPGDVDDNIDLTQTNQLTLPVRKGRHTYSLALKTNAGTAVATDARLSAAYAPKSL